MVPDLIEMQRREALAKGTHTQKVRGRVRRQLRCGEVSFGEVLVMPEFASMTLERLMLRVPGYGCRRVPTFLSRVGIKGTRVVGALTSRERAVLVAAVCLPRREPARVEAK